ncbi:MAG TPA: sugar phosphate isomerase/epimerase family protein [Limnochordia bacterium]|nr:sugar phosphate isomerase/epimerase family protein [Limnochordia bacterium]
MKLALQLGLIPGRTPGEKVAWAADHGVEGIEISAGNYPPDRIAQALADFKESKVPVVSICGNPSFDFLDPDRRKRQTSIDQCKQYLQLASDLGGVGQIVPPIFGGPRIPDLTPYKDAITLEKELLVEIAADLADYAAERNVTLLLEPLNRYEQHLLRRQADGVEICERVNRPGIAIIADFFHMHIEETNTPETIRACGKWIKHVHLADNTRQEPGTGDIDWVAGMQALRAIGFTGYMAYECGVSGADKSASLAKSLEHMRQAIAAAG